MDSDLQGAILAGVSEARSEDGAERPLSKKQAAPLELFSQLLVCFTGGFGIKKRVIVVYRLTQIRHGCTQLAIEHR